MKIYNSTTVYGSAAIDEEGKTTVKKKHKKLFKYKYVSAVR